MAMLVRHALRIAPSFRSCSITQTCALSLSSRRLSERKYTKKHEWVSVEGENGTVGITDFAAEQLGDVVFVELPDIGTKIAKGDSTGAVESVKVCESRLSVVLCESLLAFSKLFTGCVDNVQAASDIYAPVSGTVTEKNEILEKEPGKINKSPFGEGWLYKLDLTNMSELSELLNEKEYENFKKEEEGHES
ncbi:glycine cleavage system H protein [Dictyocaulus viviparus]|uniref:Glycine cleavage system H protein n=1 Tax=Dictyocaulus viviparus TaxID=29172 RepID=A0A0D8XTE5_DICVI|nr:glycine cleavage system H protein [Dictyocaulus viviparus]